MNEFTKVENQLKKNTCHIDKNTSPMHEGGISEYLLALPEYLGEIQSYFDKKQVYPSRILSGLGALMAVGMFTQGNVTVDSMDGRGLNEMYLVLGKTGFGKEAILKGMLDISNISDKRPNIFPSLPTSPQRMHDHLVNSSTNNHNQSAACFFMSDEIGEWLCDYAKSPTKQGVIGYLLQVYTKALSYSNVADSKISEQQPVKYPRVSVLGVSTGERMQEALNLSHNDSGLYNRIIYCPVEDVPIQKSYDKTHTLPSRELKLFVNWLTGLEQVTMDFSSDAWERWKYLDINYYELLKEKDCGFAGRVGEQVIKMSALLALGHKRTHIEINDIDIAHHIRCSLYHRSKAYIEYLGGVSNDKPILTATNQIVSALQRNVKNSNNKFMYESKFVTVSRAYRSMDKPLRDKVIEYVTKTNGVIIKNTAKATLYSFNPEFL